MSSQTTTVPVPPRALAPWVLPLVLLGSAYGLLALTFTEQLSHAQIMQRSVLVNPPLARIWSVGNVEIGLAYMGIFFGMLYYFLHLYSKSPTHLNDMALALAYLLGSFVLDYICVLHFEPFVAMLFGDAIVMTFTILVSRQLWFQRLLGVFVPIIFLTCGIGHLLEGTSYWYLTYPVNVPWTMVTADIGFAVLVNAGRFPAFIRGEDVVAELAQEKRRTETLRADIAARRLAEEALKRSEESFRLLFDDNPHPMWVYDLETLQFLEVNEVATLRYGYSRQEFLAMRVSDIRSAEEVPRLLEDVSAQRPNIDFSGQWRHRTKDGRLLDVEIVSHTLGFSGHRTSLVVAHDITARKAAEAEQARLQRAVDEAALRQHGFLRDVLASVTEGKLRLCDSPVDLPLPLPRAEEPLLLSAPSLGRFRQQVREVAARQGMEDARLFDLVTGVGEASMNAVVHGGGGEARLLSDGSGTLQVWIEDQGAGIGMDYLHRATLERGYTTAGSMGYGFYMMLKTCDRIWLLTGPTGTTIVVEQEREAPAPEWLLKAA